jgi:uncharacterized repeat protein (TIGR03803 family)
VSACWLPSSLVNPALAGRHFCLAAGWAGNGSVHDPARLYDDRHQFFRCLYERQRSQSVCRFEAGGRRQDKTRYGTASLGGSAGYGTVFAVNTDGSSTTLYYTNSEVSFGCLVLSSSALYGTTSEGGARIFSLSFPPHLTVASAATDIVLTWPTNYAGFDYSGYSLETTTDLGSAHSHWSACAILTLTA